jgi:ubiquitin C-terminal hydrolase
MVKERVRELNYDEKMQVNLQKSCPSCKTLKSLEKRLYQIGISTDARILIISIMLGLSEHH